MVYINMLLGKVYLVKPAIIIKPEMEGARHSMSVAHAPGSESAMLLPTTKSGTSAIMVRGSADENILQKLMFICRAATRGGGTAIYGPYAI